MQFLKGVPRSVQNQRFDFLKISWVYTTFYHVFIAGIELVTFLCKFNSYRLWKQQRHLQTRYGTADSKTIEIRSEKVMTVFQHNFKIRGRSHDTGLKWTKIKGTTQLSKWRRFLLSQLILVSMIVLDMIFFRAQLLHTMKIFQYQSHEVIC